MTDIEYKQRIPKGRRHHVWPKCPITGKVRFRERKDAKEALRKAAFARSKAMVYGQATCRNEVRAYKCPEASCGGWHITHLAQWGG